ncbi:unnamed protein product [Orchesella dallaii]|uniref:Uncharacterized protein n=1 Tax=Orchesella dallaii TaxID=48710 RepID=A0ABP1QTZ3_9HEXA
MESWLSIPILYLFLFFTQLTSAAESSSGRKGDDEASILSAHDVDLNFPDPETDPQDLARLLLMALQSNYKGQARLLKGQQRLGIPFRPVRRIGSEFLGKRSDPPIFEDSEEVVEKRARMGSEFLGKRRMGSEFLGKRGMGSEFLGKRGMGSEFLGKRRMGSEFLGKRGMGSEFLGKRRMGSEFLGKRRMGSEFLGKRGMGSEFLGKRRMGSEFLGKRRMGSEFLGKRAMGSEFLGKRRMGSEFLGKRRMGSEFLGKRGMGSEFLGKRGMGSEFLGKRGMGSEFLGKRRMGSEFLGKRRMGSEFLGKRDFDPSYTETSHQEMYPLPYFLNPLILSSQQVSDQNASPLHTLENDDDDLVPVMNKRALGSEFLGKRRSGDAYSWKRGRLGSEFLGKRSSSEPEQVYPYLQSEDNDMDLLTNGVSGVGKDTEEDNTSTN